MIWNPRVFSFNYFFVKTLHVVGAKRRIESAHFIEHTAKWPDITLRVVRHITPNFRTGIVGRACLSVTQALLDDLWDIQVTKLGLHISIQENICTLHVPMQYFSIVQRLEAPNDLNKYIPNLLFFDISFPLLVAAYFLKNIAIVGVLHYKTKKLKGEGQSSDNWITYHRLLLGSSMKASLYAMTLLWLMLARMRTSFKAFSFSLSDKLSIFTFLSA